MALIDRPDAAPEAATAAPEACDHCGLPLTAAQRRAGTRFCCAGCEVVYGLIREEGLDRYYDLRQGTTAPPPTLRTDSMAWLDELLAGIPERPGLTRLTLDLQGVHCTGCVWLLETLFRRHAGGVELRINPVLGSAELVFDRATLDLPAFLHEAGRFGYRFGPARKHEGRSSRGLVIRMGIAVAAAMNAMIFTFCFYLGLAPTDGTLYAFVGILAGLMATISVVAGGTVFVRSAWPGLRRGVAHLDLPIAVGILLAYSGSMIAHLHAGPHAAYHDTVATFAALMLVGRWLQERVLDRNRHALLADDGVENLVVRRREGGSLVPVRVDALEVGDVVWVVPGELVPVDGLLHDDACVSRDWITGESRAIELVAGDPVDAGSFNAGSTRLELTVTEPFRASRLRALLEGTGDGRTDADPDRNLPDDAAPAASAASASSAADPRRRPGKRWWDRVARIYVGAVLLLAGIGFGVGLLDGPARAVELTVAVLVVTCPCAIGLATPLAREMVQLGLRRRGVFIRAHDFFERARGVRKVLFDKTGTVTLGRLVPTGETSAALAALDDEARGVLRLLVVSSNHPVSRALDRNLASDAPLPASDAPVSERTGAGLEVRANGSVWRLGRPDFAGAVASPGTTLLTRDGLVVAALTFAEEIRSDAVDEFRALAAAGYETHLLSGDESGRVLEVAAVLGLDPARAEGGLTPEAKAARVRDLDDHDTLMVGDGVNDAPSFRVATCAATPAVDSATLPARSDLYFLGEGLAAVRRSLAAAHALHRVVRDNLALAVAYNVVALTLCFAGVITPVWAAILMPLSSVGVVSLTAFRLSRGGDAWRS